MTDTTPNTADNAAYFSQLLANQYDESDCARILEGSRATRAVTLRANTIKADSAKIAAALDAASITFERVSWYDDAFIVPDVRERAIWDLDIYENGLVYLQSLSSMMPALVLDAHAGEDVCDFCAAPGGKTSQIAALGGRSVHLTACEMHAPRAEKLRYNLQKLGAQNVMVMQTDARRLDEFFRFDRILVDAPCSGSGTLSLDNPSSMKRFTPQLVKKSTKSQAALLDRALKLVKPGGTVVYSTCSVLACENEDIVSRALKAANRHGSFELAPIPLAANPDLPTLPTRLENALALCPTNRYEGFFMAKIVRNA